MHAALEKGRPLLVEATANQVNQFGGYTGLSPAGFAAMLGELADTVGLAENQVIIGADHLGPHVWRHDPAETAMRKAEELVRQCVAAGFQKIHLDTGMCCADDPGPQLPLAEAARRAARLCRVAEDHLSADPGADPERLCYVIGNEVPAPGGALVDEKQLGITDPEQLMTALAAYRQAFQDAGADAAWPRVVAVVAQPGVEFGDRVVAVYHSQPAAALSAAHARLPGIMTFEIHSADYQPADAVQRMIQDHFILLKVGPCLTFAMREAFYMLAAIESALTDIREPSNLPAMMEHLMVDHPEHWRDFYQGTEGTQHDLRHHSYRDRMRYYWALPEAQNAIAQLVRNLTRPVPDTLFERYAPALHQDILRLGLQSDPLAIVRLNIRTTLQPYMDACWRV